MRIIIDLQGAQTANTFRDHRRLTECFAKHLISNCGGHEIILALNGSLSSYIEPIRQAFDGLVLQDNIRVWHPPSSISETSFKLSLSQVIREAFLSSLRGDVVIAPLFHSEIDIDCCVFSIGSFSNDTPTIVLVDFPPDQLSNPEANNSVAAFYQNANIGSASRILPSTILSAQEIERLIGATPQGVLEQAPSAPTQSNNQSERLAIKIVDTLGQYKNKYERGTAVDTAGCRKPKLAYLSPVPPERSGISDYSVELLPSLAQHYDIWIITDLQNIDNEWVQLNCGIQTIKDFAAQPDQYDRVLYHFGNSHFHATMFDLLERCPGVVVLHDFYLSDVQRYREAHNIPPYAWTQALYESHGYGAIQRRFKANEQDAVGRDYPANFQVLRDAIGVITHSEFSRQLAKQWYGEEIVRDWALIPHLRIPSIFHNRALSLQTLGFKEDAFIVTSFGFLGPTKANLDLLNAWLNSKLVNDERCKLVFVGENPVSEYGTLLESAIKASGLCHRIKISGWADMDAYRHYLSASDISVQLRTNSRGETSGTVLDCMNHGIATIVNATGAMAELPSDAVWMLPSDFTCNQLIDALDTLYDNSAERERLGAAAALHIHEKHSPTYCARQYHHAIEKYYSKSQKIEASVIRAIARLLTPQVRNSEVSSIACSIEKSVAAPQPASTLFVDISATHKTHLHTGIERVARALTISLIENVTERYRIEPVYLEKINGKWVYIYAREYTSAILGLPEGLFTNTIAQPKIGDIVFGVDISGDQLVQATADGFMESLRNDGVRIYFMVHDLLPITLPHTFPPGARCNHSRWLSAVARTDGAICISNAVAADLRNWMQYNGSRHGRPFFIGVSHHGADVSSSAPTVGFPSNAPSTLEALAKSPTFLMVGTIEPRKGYIQVIDAFEHLWAQGVNVNLVIVGKEGWKGLRDDVRRTIPETVQRISSHMQTGKHFFWIQDASDEYLEEIYKVSDCLIAASSGEGFGLPLIEGAKYKLPIIARDIPVFREVAGEHAYYFVADTGIQLAEHVTRWLGLYSEGLHPLVDDLPWLTWKESATNAFNILTHVSTHHLRLSLPSRPHSSTKSTSRLLVDISVVYKTDFKTGIQRVVRAVLACLLSARIEGYEVVPVFLELTNGNWCYKSAVVYFDSRDIIFDTEFAQASKDIVPLHNDILLGLDLAGGYVVNAARAGLYRKFKDAGARVYFVVYDLLPVTMPQFFAPGDTAGHEDWLRAVSRADGVICISEATAQDYLHWSAKLEDGERPDPEFRIRSFHLGADIGSSSPTFGMPEDSSVVLDKLRARPTFLMVGTIEPRKGHSQVLGAFELLWSSKLEVNLVIVGKEGWMTEEFSERLRNHPNLNSCLFWLEGVSDQYLEHIYTASSCLIAASEGEGFGLPLIEAAQHNLPIVARDLAVFREVAGDHAFYFNGQGASELATIITKWLALHAAGMHPTSRLMPWLTWKQSTNQLIDRILLN